MLKGLVRTICVTSVVVILLALACVIAAAAPNQSPPVPPFQFAEGEELEITWKDIEAGKAKVSIWNNGTTTLTLTVELSEMGFKDWLGKEGKTASFLEPAANPVTVPPRASADIVLKSVSYVCLGVGSYSGFLHVSDGDTAIHLPIKIIKAKGATTPATAETGEPATPLVKAWEVRHYRILPWLPVGITTNSYLPLDVDPHVGKAIALDPDAPLGFLTAPRSGMARVGWTGSPKTESYDKQAIRLTFSGLEQVGEYTGEIDTLPDDEENGVVTVTAKVTDWILWPIVAILAGILLAWGVKTILNVNQPLDKLWIEWLKKKSQDPKKVRIGETATLKDPTDKPKYRGYSIADSFGRQTQRIGEAIAYLQKRYKGTTVVLDSSNESYKKIEVSLQALEKQLEEWAGFGNELDQLDEALEEARACSNSPDWQKCPKSDKDQTTTSDEVTLPTFLGSAFDEHAKTLLNGVELRLEEADVDLDPKDPNADTGPGVQKATVHFRTRRAEVLECTATVKSWVSWANRLKTAKCKFKDVKPKVINSLPKIVLEAQFELSRIECLLGSLKKPADFESAELEQGLLKAEGLVAGLKCWPAEFLPQLPEDRAEELKFLEEIDKILEEMDKPSDAQHPSMQAEPLAEALTCWQALPKTKQARLRGTLKAAVATAEPSLVTGFFPLAPVAARPAPPPEPEKEITAIRRRLMRNNWYIFLLQFVIAVAVVLGSQYFSSEWGTLLDWAKALGSGFATTTAFEALFGALNRLLGASK